MSVSPTGVGGFVEVQTNPVGEVYGRQLDAWANILVRTNGDGINAAVAAVANALMSADRTTLLTNGILRLTLDTLGPVSAAPGLPVMQQVQFRVLFEYLKRPAVADGVIQTVPVNIQLQQS